ncbi:MAG: peptidylprolyl isomerase [Anaerolineae bacterium]|nr:peptidylprolyl isomerase [Anaerolineae bacterium]
MAKRDTTGGPRQRRMTEEDIARRREYKSKAEIEHQYQRIVLLVAGVIVAIVVIIILGAIIYDNAVLPREALVTVNDDEVSVNEFQGRVQYTRFQLAEQIRATYRELRALGVDESTAQNQIFQIFQEPINYLISDNALGETVLTQMERERVIEQKAKQFDLEVNDDQIDDEVGVMIANFTGRSLTETPSATPSEEPSTTPTPFVSATPSSTPTETPVPTDTPVPTVEGCAEGEACATVTLVPSVTPGDPLQAVTFTPTPSATFTPLAQEQVAATVQAFRGDFFEKGDEETRFNEDDIKDVFYYAALENALKDYITTTQFLPGEVDADGEPLENIYYVPEQDTYVKVRHILIQFPEGVAIPEEDTENEYYQEALQVYEALQAGQPFAALAAIHSDDPGSKDNGGFYDWSPTSNYAEGFREATEDTPVGEFVGPVRSQFGYHIIQVLDREVREVTSGELESRRTEQFNLWLDGEITLARIQRREDWLDFVPEDPTYNELLSDIMPEYDRNTGFGS